MNFIKIIIVGIFFAGIFGLGANKAQAAQYFANRYSFTQQGELAAPLFMHFKEVGKKKMEVKLSPFNSTTSILTVACSLGEDMFLTNLSNGFSYALYKIDFRPGQEDLLILCYGPTGTGKTMLKGVSIIGEENAVVRTLPIAGFEEVAVFNSPLQVRNKQAVLFRDKGAELVMVEYDHDLGSYVVRGTKSN